MRMQCVKLTLILAAVFSVHCGNTGIYDDALTVYARVVRPGLNEWYPLNGNLSSRIGSIDGTATAQYSAGTNRAGEGGKTVCTSNSTLTFSQNTIGANPFTISAWFYFNGIPGGTNSLLERGAGCTQYNGLIVQQTGTGITFTHGSCGVNAGTLNANMSGANTWIYLAISYGNGIGNLYVGSYGNSLQTLTTPPGRDYAQYSTTFKILAGATVSACVDDFLNYNRALSSAEVQQNFLSVE